MAKNRMFLYGKNSVYERLRTNPESIRQIFIQDNFRSPEIMTLIHSRNIPFKSVPETEILKIKRADRLQGIIAETRKFKYADFDALLNEGISQGTSLIFLDGLNDPHNLGSMIRIAACFGGFAIVIPEHGSCGITDAVIHVASGGENYVPVGRVVNLATALLKAKKAGFWTAGTFIEGGQDINTVSLPFPLCIVFGAEGKGIRHGIKKHLDLELTLPLKGAQLSMNVAMAFAVFANEIVRQRGTLFSS